MKYTPEITQQLLQDHQSGVPVPVLAQTLGVPERSVIAKLSSLGVYQRKTYLNKRGEPPQKKAEMIEKIANLLNVNIELLESLEKANKNVLLLLEAALKSE
jgi:hypothetical protein